MFFMDKVYDIEAEKMKRPICSLVQRTTHCSQECLKTVLYNSYIKQYMFSNQQSTTWLSLNY